MYAIIAFWNAPCDIVNHERKIVETAVECQIMLKNLEDEFVKLAGRPLYTRIGLNTGYAVVGNMGSDKRFDYTMFGDSVNLASRLEGINKAFGTYTICSEETCVNAIKQGCDFYFRKLSDVKVVGKNQAVAVFEPVQKEYYEENKIIFENFEKARKLFEKGEFILAKKLFDLNKTDGASRKFSSECSTSFEKILAISILSSIVYFPSFETTLKSLSPRALAICHSTWLISPSSLPRTAISMRYCSVRLPA